MASISLKESGMGNSPSSTDMDCTNMSGVISSFSYIMSVREAAKYEADAFMSNLLKFASCEKDKF